MASALCAITSSQKHLPDVSKTSLLLGAGTEIFHFNFGHTLILWVCLIIYGTLDFLTFVHNDVIAWND